MQILMKVTDHVVTVSGYTTELSTALLSTTPAQLIYACISVLMHTLSEPDIRLPPCTRELLPLM
jgi:hypothetical protein